MTTAGVTSVPSIDASGYLDLTLLFVRPDGNVDLFLAGSAGQTYIVQATTNFVTWTNISASLVVNNNYLVSFTDTNAHLYPYRFYRLLLSGSGQLTSLTRTPPGVVSLQIIGSGRTDIHCPGIHKPGAMAEPLNERGGQRIH